MNSLILLFAVLVIVATEEIKCDAKHKCPPKYVCLVGTCMYRCPIWEPDVVPIGCRLKTFTDRRGCERKKVVCNKKRN